jgi:hypothetical protein
MILLYYESINKQIDTCGLQNKVDESEFEIFVLY